MRERKSAGLGNYLKQLLLIDESPERTAATFSFGVLLGFSPLIGLNWVVALVVILVFKVNGLAFLAGTYSNTPWTWAPSATLGTALGYFLLGIDSPLPELTSADLTSSEFWQLLSSDVQSFFLPFFVGNFVLSGTLALIAYPISKQFLQRYGRRARQKRREERRARRAREQGQEPQ